MCGSVILLEVGFGFGEEVLSGVVDGVVHCIRTRDVFVNASTTVGRRVVAHFGKSINFDTKDVTTLLEETVTPLNNCRGKTHTSDDLLAVVEFDSNGCGANSFGSASAGENEAMAS
jgi:hypothetical protein